MIFQKRTKTKKNTYTSLTNRDVLIGTVKSKNQFYASLKNRFYHIPAFMIQDHPCEIKYIALYQSIRLWGMEACIKYYGEVKTSKIVSRNEIEEWFSDSTEEYIRFDIKEWKQLIRPIRISENMIYVCEFTNYFLLTHSYDATQLIIESEQDYKLSQLLIDGINDFRINDLNAEYGFEFEQYNFKFHDGNINILKNNKLVVSYSSKEYMKKPGIILKSIKETLKC